MLVCCWCAVGVVLVWCGYGVFMVLVWRLCGVGMLLVCCSCGDGVVFVCLWCDVGVVLGWSTTLNRILVFEFLILLPTYCVVTKMIEYDSKLYSISNVTNKNFDVPSNSTEN